MNWILAGRALLLTSAATLGHLHGKWMYSQHKLDNEHELATDVPSTKPVEPTKPAEFIKPVNKIDILKITLKGNDNSMR